MDLERLGTPALAEQFMAGYAEYSGDPAPVSLCHHYIAYRAFVRVKVACLRVVQDLPEAGRTACQLADLALRHLRAGAVTLVLVGGLPGTGKSALAGAVADRLGLAVLSSDRIRKELAGAAEASAPVPYESGIYCAGWTERVYAELLHRATVLLAHGESVIARTCSPDDDLQGRLRRRGAGLGTADGPRRRLPADRRSSGGDR